MVKLEYIMTYWERISGPLQSTFSPVSGERVCWQIEEATLKGSGISAKSAFPGTDWMRVGNDRIRRADLRIQLIADNGATILMAYNNAIIHSSDTFLSALKAGVATDFEDQYMRMTPVFETGADTFRWLNESIFIGVGRLAGKNQIEYEIFRVC